MIFAERHSDNNISQRTPEQIRQELARSALFSGFEKLVNVNTPLQCVRQEQNSLHADLPTESGEEQRVTLHLDSVVYIPSCWGPDTRPLEVRIYLGEDPEFFVLGPFGHADVKRATGLFSAEIAREFTEEDQGKLKDLLDRMQKAGVKFDHFLGYNPYRH